MVHDVLLNKVAVIERCLARIEEETRCDDPSWEKDQTRQDAIVLNLLRACEASIDLAMHIVRIRRLGIPQTSRDAFDLLYRAGILPDDLRDRLEAMVGFRNIVVHDDPSMSLPILRSILDSHLDDFRAWTAVALRVESLPS